MHPKSLEKRKKRVVTTTGGNDSDDEDENSLILCEGGFSFNARIGEIDIIIGSQTHVQECFSILMNSYYGRNNLELLDHTL